ncbi:MAG: hypothetical protein HYS26_04200 [Candidatus Kaiserbacteria bacterium]|nr:MAG: hypothetical protein HYS26_04200 [Candidatus Kaiserbacteria bacterium]
MVAPIWAAQKGNVEKVVGATMWGMPKFEGIKPNTPEHVEVVKTDVIDYGNKISFTFTFAQPQKWQFIHDLWHGDRNHTMPTTIWKKLQEKGWAGEAYGEETYGSLTSYMSASPDWKTWTIQCEQNDPDFQVQKQ